MSVILSGTDSVGAFAFITSAIVGFSADSSVVKVGASGNETVGFIIVFSFNSGKFVVIVVVAKSSGGGTDILFLIASIAVVGLAGATADIPGTLILILPGVTTPIEGDVDKAASLRELKKD
jgi:hypothetical protein